MITFSLLVKNIIIGVLGDLAVQFSSLFYATPSITIKIKQFRGQSQVANLEQAMGQYTLYRLLLNQVDPERDLYLAISDATYSDI